MVVFEFTASTSVFPWVRFLTLLFGLYACRRFGSLNLPFSSFDGTCFHWPSIESDFSRFQQALNPIFINLLLVLNTDVSLFICLFLMM